VVVACVAVVAGMVALFLGGAEVAGKVEVSPCSWGSVAIVGDSSVVVNLVASVVVACVIVAGTVGVVIFIGDAEVAADVEQAAVNPSCRSVVIFGAGASMMVDSVADVEVAVGRDCSRSTSSALFPFVASPSSLRFALIWTTVGK